MEKLMENRPQSTARLAPAAEDGRLGSVELRPEGLGREGVGSEEEILLKLLKMDVHSQPGMKQP